MVQWKLRYGTTTVRSKNQERLGKKILLPRLLTKEEIFDSTSLEIAAKVLTSSKRFNDKITSQKYRRFSDNIQKISSTKTCKITSQLSTRVKTRKLNTYLNAQS